MEIADFNSEKIKQIRIEIREKECHYFTDETIIYYLERNNGDVNKTIYDLLILKSEDSAISVSGLNTQDTSSYFKRLASRYKPFNSRVLK